MKSVDASSLLVTLGKLLRVLITNNHLFRRGGSETFTYALAQEFERRGDLVEVYTIERGIFSLFGMNVVDQPGPAYDLILFSHNTCLPKVSIC